MSELPFPLTPTNQAYYLQLQPSSQALFIRVWTMYLYHYSMSSNALGHGLNGGGLLAITAPIYVEIANRMQSIGETLLGLRAYTLSRELCDHLFHHWMFTAYADISRIEFVEERARFFVSTTSYDGSALPVPFPN